MFSHPPIEAFERYITSVRTPGTARKYAISTQKFLTWCADSGWADLVTAPRSAVANYCVALVEAGYSASTVQMQLAGVRRYIKWAAREDERIPVFHDPEPPRNVRRIKDVLAPEVFEAYFDLAEKLREPSRTAAMLLPCAGLRSNEMTTLPLDCLKVVPVDMGEAGVKSTLSLRVTNTKGGDERIIPLLDEGAEILREYLSSEGWRSKHPDADWLFPGSRNVCMSDRTLRKAVEKVREPLGLKFTSHTMRRTYLTTLYRRGVPAATLAKISGHKDVKTLIESYLDLNAADLAEAVHTAGGSLFT